MQYKIKALYKYTLENKGTYHDQGKVLPQPPTEIEEEVFVLDIKDKTALVSRRVLDSENGFFIKIEEMPLDELIISDESIMPKGIVKKTADRISVF